MVNEETKPTQEQIEECKQYYNGEIGEKRIDSWYSLLHEAQGSLMPYKRELKYMIDSEDFITQSLVCEWGWIINLDTNELEIYLGFQETPNNNRYSIDKTDDYGYYSCALFKSIPLNKVSENMMQEIENESKLFLKDA